MLVEGAHYGWPYCYDMNKPTPDLDEIDAIDCRPASTKARASDAAACRPARHALLPGRDVPAIAREAFDVVARLSSRRALASSPSTSMRSGVPVVTPHARYLHVCVRAITHCAPSPIPALRRNPRSSHRIGTSARACGRWARPSVLAIAARWRYLGCGRQEREPSCASRRTGPRSHERQLETTPMADYGFNTLAVHAGAQPDPATGARATPIYQTTSYVFEDADHAASLFNLQVFGNIYTRLTNPTTAVLEERIAALEGGTAALAASSGHAAQFLIFHTLMEPGGEFVAAKQLYGGSVNQFGQAFTKYDWRVKWADSTNPESFRARHHREDARHLRRKPGQPGRHHHRSRKGRARGREGGRAAHRRQHHGDALSHPAVRMGRRHHRAFRHQIPWRARQFAGRRAGRRRQIRLGQVRQVQDDDRAEPVVSRAQILRDVRGFRLLRGGARARPARHRPRDGAV